MKKHKHLQYLRKRKGYTFAELSKKVGITAQYLSELERGKKTLSYKLAFIISNVLETTPDELFLDDFKK